MKTILACAWAAGSVTWSIAACRDFLPSCLFAGRLCCRRKRARARATIDVAAMFAGLPSLLTSRVVTESAHNISVFAVSMCHIAAASGSGLSSCATVTYPSRLNCMELSGIAFL